MIFRRSKKHVKKSMGTMDKVVTGIIIGGAAASIFGLSRTEKGRNILSRFRDTGVSVGKKGFRLLGKTSIKILDLFSKR